MSAAKVFCSNGGAAAVLSFALLSIWPHVAQAVSPGVTAGGSGTYSFRQCSTCPDEGSREVDSHGGEGVSSAISASPIGTPYLWSASASLQGPSQLPLLGAYAEAGNPLTVSFVSSSSSATGLQKYLYLGSEAGRYTIDFSVNGQLKGDGENLSGGITVFDSSYDPAAEFNPRLAAERVTLRAPSVASPTMLSESRSVSFDVAAGQVFYVFAFLSADAFWSDGGSAPGYADGSHTLSARFSAGSLGLLQPVPEPPVAWLLAVGLVAIGWRQTQRGTPR